MFSCYCESDSRSVAQAIAYFAIASSLSLTPLHIVGQCIMEETAPQVPTCKALGCGVGICPRAIPSWEERIIRAMLSKYCCSMCAFKHLDPESHAEMKLAAHGWKCKYNVDKEARRAEAFQQAQEQEPNGAAETATAMEIDELDYNVVYG